MKYLIVLVIFFYVDKVYTQDVVSGAQKRTKDMAYLRDTKITIDNITFDYRVLKYYSELDLQKMTPVKRKQVNFLFTNSYKISGIEKCPSFSVKDIDVGAIESLREEDIETAVQVGKDCKVNLILMPRNLLTEKMKELEQ